MTKRVFIIHGWGGSPNEIMHKMLFEKLSRKGSEVKVLEMPNTDEPEIKSWISHLNEIAGKPDKNTYFIGHSIGCQTIMRYLEKLDEKIKIGGCIFIAGWFNLENMESDEEKRIAKPWIETPINYSKMKKMAKNIVVYISSNEFYGCIDENIKIFKEKLGAEVIIVKDMGHFTDEEGITKLNEFTDRLVKDFNQSSYIL